MSEVWCVTPQTDHFPTKPCSSDQKTAFSSLNNHERGLPTKDIESMFAANIQGLSNISLLSNMSGAGSGSGPAEYSLFCSDGLPPPVSNSGTEQKPLSRSSSSETFWSSSENSNRSRNFHLGFDLSDSSAVSADQNRAEPFTGGISSKNDKDKIAAAIWAHLPEPVPKVQSSKAVGAEMRQQPFLLQTGNVDGQALPNSRVISSGKPLMQGSVPSVKGINNYFPAKRQQLGTAPIQIHQPLAIPTATWTTSQGQLVTILPAGTVQGNQIFRTPALIQPRVINPGLVPINQNITRAPEISNIITANRPSQASTLPIQPTLTAPQLHSAIGQINELTVHALNQTAAMIMDRHQLESKLLHLAPEQFRSVYNELALPEPLEPIPGRKETAGVDMLLTAQLRENLRINTLVRRIKVVAQLAPSAAGTQVLEKWTEDVCSFQSFLIKMHERARRLHLSSTIAATLYSNNDSSTRTNDSAVLAGMLNELMTSTLNARQALFQLGESAIMLLSVSHQRKSASPSSRDRTTTGFPAINGSENVRPVTNFQQQPIPVNPESAQQLWRQLGQLQSQGF